MPYGAMPFMVGRMRGQGAQTPPIRRYPEAAAQTFQIGTPVQLNAGYLQECAAIVNAATAEILGMATEDGSSLTSAGVAEHLDQGHPINQPLAVVIPGGVKMNDGMAGVVLAIDDVEFVGRLATTNTEIALAVTHRDFIAGITEDAVSANGFWYVDVAKTTVAGGACVQIIDLLDPVGTVGGRVLFRILNAAQQLGHQALGA